MKESTKNIIILDAINSYFDILTKRINTEKGNEAPRIYVGDFVIYVVTLFHNNGLDIMNDSENIIMDTLTNILSIYFQLCGVNTPLASWSDDMCYILLF